LTHQGCDYQIARQLIKDQGTFSKNNIVVGNYRQTKLKGEHYIEYVLNVENEDDALFFVSMFVAVDEYVTF
jgi:hypothetical protein